MDRRQFLQSALALGLVGPTLTVGSADPEAVIIDWDKIVKDCIDRIVFPPQVIGHDGRLSDLHTPKELYDLLDYALDQRALERDYAR